MTLGSAVGLVRDSVLQLLIISGPILLVSVIVGLAISILQATTSIQEQTLTFVPIDRRLISMSLLNSYELKWINNYHSQCWKRAKDLVTAPTKAWLKTMTKPLQNIENV